METLVVHCQTKIQDVIPQVIESLASKLDRCGEDEVILKILLLNVIAASSFYMPELFLQSCEHANVLHPVFTQWLSSLQHNHVYHYQKVSFIGLMALSLVPFNRMPEQLRNAFGDVLKQAIDLLVSASTADDTQKQEVTIDEVGSFVDAQQENSPSTANEDQKQADEVGAVIDEREAKRLRSLIHCVEKR
jgi:hypothetical protein